MVGTYLYFDGNCVDALALYERAFGIKTAELQKYGDVPGGPGFEVKEEEKNLVLHSCLILDGTEIMCSDAHMHAAAGENMYVSVTTEDEKLVLGAWEVLKEKGRIYMELQPSFFALHHGSLQDQFGINWMFTVMKPGG